MIVERLKSRLCKDLLVESHTDEGRSIAVTSMWYPNGDSVSLYFGQAGETRYVTDEGTTIDFLLRERIEITKERKQVIGAMCKTHDVSFNIPRLIRYFEMEEIGAACLDLCQAVTRVSSIHYQVTDRMPSPLPIAVGKLLRKKVKKTRSVARKWVDLKHDPKGSYPVDFHLNGIGTPRNIFTVSSPNKCVMVSAVVHFLRSHGLDFPTMTVVDTTAGLGHRDLDRLQLASTEIRFGLEKNEDDIVDFALSK